MDRRLMRFPALLAVVSLVAGACLGSPPGGGSAAPSGAATGAAATATPEVTGTVRWFVGLGTGTDPAQVKVENEIVAAFNKAHPKIKLTIEVVPYEQSQTVLGGHIAAGRAPDIVGPVGVSGAEAFHAQWLDLAPFIQKTNYDLSGFDQEVVDYYKVGGEGQVGIPFAVFPSMLFYQRDMFDEADLNYPPQAYGEKYKWKDGREVDWDFNTLREVAMKLTVDKSNKDATQAGFNPRQIVQYGYEPQYQDARAIGSYFGAGSLVADDGKTAQVPPEWAEAWKWVYDGVWKDHFIPTQPVRDSTEYAEGNPFNSGKVAMGLSHLWYTCCLADAGKNWDIAPVPSYNGKVTSNLNADTFRIFKGTKNADASFVVLQYLLGEASPKLLEAYSGMPARKSDQQAFFDGLDKKFTQDVNWDVAKAGMAYPDIPSFESYTPSYKQAFDYVVKFLNKLYATPNLDVDKEVATFQQQLQAIFDRQT
jgi:multiple sugar transport system substrate-binding protein